MSWVRKRTQSPNPAPPVQMYNPNQHHSTQDNQWQDNWPKSEQQPQFWQQPAYSQQFHDQNYYQQQQNYANYPQYNQNAQPVPTQQQEGDWSDWGGWGDDDNSNTAQSNSIADSFTNNDQSWQWNSQTKPQNRSQELLPKVGASKSEITPQWSIESQASQASSDDVLHTSDSDKVLSRRSSTKSHSSAQDLAIADLNREIVGNLPPLPNSAPTDDSNPHKRNAVLSHKTANLFHSTSQPDSFLGQSFNQSVNLETVPDNSEQPDTLQAPLRPPTQKQRPDNNELPSINDRNQYLETGQLSASDFNQDDNLNDNDALPPPGLRRMVLGQLEQNETVLNSSDEPPPGLSRMIPGRIETSSNGNITDLRQTFQPIEPAEDGPLHRMIPGQSSPPEAVQSAAQPEPDDSEPELGEISKSQPRSATIGADTPPTTNASRPEPNQDQSTRKKSQKNDNRRDSVERKDSKLDKDEENLSGNNNTERKHKKQDSSDESEPRRRYRDTKETRGRYSLNDDYYNRDKKYYDKRKYNKRYNEDDSDYYNSDKERENRRRKEEYDRKYNSLRRDNKEKKRRDYDGRKNYYDNYENESKSRASSRSDSMHDSYRDNRPGQDRERRDRRYREKERHRQRHHHRDPFAGYPGYGYDMYHYQYQYYENLRKTNPQAYAQLYRNYYQTDLPANYSGGVEDRASVHSGRSSANEELSKDSSFARNFDQTDTSINYEEANVSKQQEHRYTPAKFTTAHTKASIQSGKLVKIVPNYAQIDGNQAAVVELRNLEEFLTNDEDYLELKRFPGPLVKGVTHKKTVIEYCEGKVKAACNNNLELNADERDSYILMWELLILLLRQNGMVIGTDIAELLLKDRNFDQKPPIHRSTSTISSVNSAGCGEVVENVANDNQLKEEEITNKFREYLLYGSCKEALEWAMKYGLWGHALFLANKLDKRTYANVMMRFANGLTINDPLQTLYQLLSGKIPAAVTCVADEKWGDWKPHLAMILSNSTQRPELNFKAITQLGDTLMIRGNLYAAQFCYLMAQIDFSNFNDRDNGAKLVLLGTNHWHLPAIQYAATESIHMTEIYEYACTLNDDNFTITEFQHFKYLLSTRLADLGLLEKSLAYLERISVYITKNPKDFKPTIVNNVINLADRLKYYDPIGYDDDEEETIDNRPDNSWLKQLRSVQNDFNMGLITEEISNLGLTSTENDYGQQPQYEQYQQWNESQQKIEQQEQHQDTVFAPVPSYQDQQQQFWPNQQQWIEPSATFTQDSVDQQQYYGSTAQTEEIQRPQISMPNQTKGKTIYDNGNDSLSKETAKKPIPRAKTGAVKENKQDNGWFGGIFSKLSLKPKNQMKLPDDKNPSIVWDQDKKRWMNTDEDNADSTNELKPPPKMTEFTQKPTTLPANIPEVNGNVAKPPIPPQSNMFKLQKSRNLKKSYIDVFNPNAKAGVQQNLAAPPVQQPSQFNFFIPQPVNDPNAPTDFLTPAPLLQYDENSQQSQQ